MRKIAVAFGILSLTTAAGPTPRTQRSATAQRPADLLPLKHGFYVDSSIACGSAARVDVQLYEGRTLIGTRGQSCKVTSKKVGVSTWQIRTLCDGGNRGMIDAEQTIRVTSATTFDDIHNGQAYPARYCAVADMSDEYRHVIVR